MGSVKCTPQIEVRPLTTTDAGLVVQTPDGGFAFVATDESRLFLMSFKGFCHFGYTPYNGEPLVVFDSPVIVTPKLTTYRANVSNEHLSLALFFDEAKGGPFVCVNNPPHGDARLYPLPASHRPTMPLPAGPRAPAQWTLFNLVTGESQPGDDVLRRAYSHWTLDIANIDGSRTRLIDINETTIASAVAKQHNIGLR